MAEKKTEIKPVAKKPVAAKKAKGVPAKASPKRQTSKGKTNTTGAKVTAVKSSQKATPNQSKAPVKSTAKPAAKPTPKPATKKPTPKPTKPATKEKAAASGKIFVTGASGFLGCHIADKLPPKTSRLGVRQRSSMTWLGNNAAEKAIFDLRDKSTWADALKGVDVIINCSALLQARLPSTLMKVNGIYAGEFARAAAEAGVKRFVQVSSLAASGYDETGAKGAYAKSKLKGEEEIQKAAADFPGFEVCFLRLGAIFGPRDKEFLKLFKLVKMGLLPSFPEGNLLQAIYVDDAAEACLKAATCAKLPENKVLDVVQNERLQWPEVIALIQELSNASRSGVKVPAAIIWFMAVIGELQKQLYPKGSSLDLRRASDILLNRSYTGDPKPAIKAFDLKLTPFKDALEETVRWYKHNNWLKD